MKPPRTLGLLSPEHWHHRLAYHLEQLSKTVSNISFGQTLSNADQDKNMVCHKTSGTTPGVANTEFAVTHMLPYVPIGFLIISTAPPGHIYKSTTAWTAATKGSLGNIYLKSDTASVAYSLIIL